MSIAAGADTTHDHVHIVGFYDGDDALVEAVATFLADALDQTGVAVVIATDSHRVALAAELAARGFALDALARAGRYVVLDAAETLRSFMRDGTPELERFAPVMEQLLADVAAVGAPVRVFGEMVALLWDGGNVSAALELETLWNDLATRHDFALFCAYAMSLLEASGDLEAAKRICDRHSGVVTLSGANDGHAAPASRAAIDGRAAGDCFERTFVATPASLRQVRRFLDSVFAQWGEEQTLNDAAVVVSELAANAVAHARSPFRVTISRTESSIRIATRDTSGDAPRYLVSGLDRRGGRGIRLVAALSDAWGTDVESGGKTVWAELTRSGSVTTRRT